MDTIEIACIQTFENLKDVVRTRAGLDGTMAQSSVALTTILLDASLNTLHGTVLTYVVDHYKRTGACPPGAVWEEIFPTIHAFEPELQPMVVTVMPQSFSGIKDRMARYGMKIAGPDAGGSRLADRIAIMEWCFKHTYGPSTYTEIPMVLSEKDFVHIRMLSIVTSDATEMGFKNE